MAKYTNVDVLGNIKLNGAIYTNASDSTKPAIKPAIKYDNTSGCWVYRNDNDAWIKFSDSDVNIITSIDNTSSYTPDDVANVNAMSSFIQSYVANAATDVSITKTSGVSGTTLTWTIDGVSDSINIDKEKWLTNVKYDSDNKDLIFTVSGANEVTIPISGFIHAYSAGDGIALNNNNEFSLVKDTNNADSKYLVIGNDTIGLSGISDEISKATSGAVELKKVDKLPTIQDQLSGYKHSTLLYTDNGETAVVCVSGSNQTLINTSMPVSNTIENTCLSAIPTVQAVSAFFKDSSNPYVLPVAGINTLGGILSGNDISVDNYGNVTVLSAQTAETALSAQTAETALSAQTAVNSLSANQVTYDLIIGDKKYNGAQEIKILASDLGALTGITPGNAGIQITDNNTVSLKLDNTSNYLYFTSGGLAISGLAEDEIIYTASGGIPASGEANKLYITEQGQAAYFNDENACIDLSIQLVDEINISYSDAVPTVGAVSTFVDTKINNIDFPDFDGFYTGGSGIVIDENNAINVNIAVPSSVKTNDNYLFSNLTGGVYTSGITEKFEEISGDVEQLKAISGNAEVFYISSFANYETIESGLYIAENGEAKFYTGSGWVQTSYQMVNEIKESNDKQVPSVNAVSAYVTSKIPEVITYTSRGRNCNR